MNVGGGNEPLSPSSGQPGSSSSLQPASPPTGATATGGTPPTDTQASAPSTQAQEASTPAEGETTPTDTTALYSPPAVGAPSAKAEVPNYEVTNEPAVVGATSTAIVMTSVTGAVSANIQATTTPNVNNTWLNQTPPAPAPGYLRMLASPSE
jgi:hypothetical protein